MSSTTAVVPNVNYHLPKQVSQEFSHSEPPRTAHTCILPHVGADVAHAPCPLQLPAQSTQNSSSTSKSGLGVSKRLISSNIDSALRSSLKPWLNTAITRDQTSLSVGIIDASDFARRSLTFHESLAPPLDYVIRQKIEGHPNSLILSDTSPTETSEAATHSLCSDSELATLCRSGGEHVPSQSLGLSNSGNTCYLNSVLQCLLATGPLLAYASTKHCSSDSCSTTSGQLGPNRSRFCALCGLLRLLREHNQRMQPANVRTPSCGVGHILPSYFLANVRAATHSLCSDSELATLCRSGGEHVPSQSLGLSNSGNTCYLNSVLQCLLATGPLLAYASTKHCSSDSCSTTSGQLGPNRSRFCALCGLLRLLREHNQRMQPANVRTPSCGVGHILPSYITCHTCHNVSARDEISFNLSVDITCGRSLQQCLFNYIHSEELCGQNAYKCEKCRQYRSATRRSTILRGGPILIIQFNRFSRNQKLDTRVEFPSSFNLRPFMTDTKGPPVLYRLYGTVNHEGYSCRSGHYVAFTRRHGLWLSHNDCFVNSTNVEHVLRQTPYLLFYEAVNPIQSTPGITPCPTPKEQTKPTGVTDKPSKQSSTIAPAFALNVPLPMKSASVPSTTSVELGTTQTPTKPVNATGQTSLISTPRIVFNPNIKQRPSLNTVISTICTTNTTTTPSNSSPFHTVTKPVVVSTEAQSSSCTADITCAVDVIGKSTAKSCLATFTSATVRQLLYGEASTPGLWSERPTPAVPVSTVDPANQSQVKVNGRVRLSDDQRTSPRKRKHSPSSTVQVNASPMSGLSENPNIHDSEPAVRSKRTDVSDTPIPAKQSRRVSESSSDSSIVWIPKNSLAPRLHEHSTSLKNHKTNGVNGHSSSSHDRSQLQSDVDRPNRKHRHRHHHKKRKHRELDNSNPYRERYDEHHYHTHRKEHRNGSRHHPGRGHSNNRRYTVFHRPHNFSRRH
ncbi:Ubiquitin carboxyl-terminal hydrolase 36 [Fasciola hepatica]|uniref:Ubiquitin carboxyl-terminal hydrolase n=1 Tax=Fasciola hepatica TaxID=6192 RepID=A0A4E0R415_FASHE|nr:Ubiquitin carboxyl-terminal hydrolase 36 [Fasciola hepatica]